MILLATPADIVLDRRQIENGGLILPTTQIPGGSQTTIPAPTILSQVLTSTSPTPHTTFTSSLRQSLTQASSKTAAAATTATKPSTSTPSTHTFHWTAGTIAALAVSMVAAFTFITAITIWQTRHYRRRQEQESIKWRMYQSPSPALPARDEHVDSSSKARPTAQTPQLSPISCCSEVSTPIGIAPNFLGRGSTASPEEATTLQCQRASVHQKGSFVVDSNPKWPSRPLPAHRYVHCPDRNHHLIHRFKLSASKRLN